MSDQLDQSFPGLEDELIQLGRALVPPPPPADLPEAVLARITAPVHERSGAAIGSVPQPRPRFRRVAWVVAALVTLVVVVVPPVRAAVLELLRIGGVTIQQHPEPSELPRRRSTSSASPNPAAAVTLAEAQAALGSPISLPTVLGAPDAVSLLQDRHVARFTWHRAAGDLALDVFSGSPDYGYLKQVWTELTATKVGAHEAIWIGSPHLLHWVDRSDRARPDPVRVAGPTLVWVVPDPAGTVTYRLEGPRTLAAATAIAVSSQ